MSLPEGWRIVNYKEAFSQLSTTHKKVKTKDCTLEGIFPVVDQGQELICGYFEDKEKLIKLDNPVIIFGDHTRVIKWIDFDFIPGADGTKILNPKDIFYPKFFYYQMRNIVLPDKGYSRHFKFLKEVDFVLPPLTQQKQIAQKLDQVLAHVERIKTALDNTPTTIKRFQQSVLALAISGGLSNGKNWESLTINDVVHVKGGKRLPKGEQLVFEDTGFPYIKAGQLKNGTVNPNKQEYLTKETQQKISKYIVKEGDVYITIVGACIGDAGKIPKEFNNANLTENAVKLCEFKKELDSDFLAYWIRSYHIQTIISRETKSGAQGKLAIKRIKTLPFYLPPLKEQKAIVKKVETLFALANSLEVKVNQAQKQVDRLTQSILAKAFRGELV